MHYKIRRQFNVSINQTNQLLSACKNRGKHPHLGVAQNNGYLLGLFADLCVYLHMAVYLLRIYSVSTTRFCGDFAFLIPNKKSCFFPPPTTRENPRASAEGHARMRRQLNNYTFCLFKRGEGACVQYVARRPRIARGHRAKNGRSRTNSCETHPSFDDGTEPIRADAWCISCQVRQASGLWSLWSQHTTHYIGKCRSPSANAYP
eukprot:GEMP01076208.1.p1 GENE.GEMP01076208.1~~GEMP01076208.1.p1  ORF type:complete len:204 (-),score=8.64 GEMP01076208.1:8-619(-)